jgi:hypothetical protein
MLSSSFLKTTEEKFVALMVPLIKLPSLITMMSWALEYRDARTRKNSAGYFIDLIIVK